MKNQSKASDIYKKEQREEIEKSSKVGLSCIGFIGSVFGSIRIVESEHK